MDSKKRAKRGGAKGGRRGHTSRARGGGEGLAARLNRNVRSRAARVRFVEDVAFGEAMAVRRYRLGNGLNVLLVDDRSAPVVSYHTWFRVGSRHEQPGKTGLAHLFEHLMFNETEALPAGEFDRLFEEAGGETNAATWTDWTFYYENLPKKHLDLAIRLEAERMARLVVREPQVASEKEVVANERRYRVDDDVEGAVNEQLFATAFKRHPYRWPTIGWMRDIERFAVDDCLDFYRTYYAPNNATVVVVGAVDEAEALASIQEHYGSHRRAPIPPEKHIREARPSRERVRTMELPTETPKVQLGYPAPAFSDPNWAILTVAIEVLTGGRSSRLYQRLVNEEEVASEVRTSITPFRDPGLLEVWASARTGVTAERILRMVDQELKRLRDEPVSGRELEKAKNRLELSFLHGMETAAGKAEQVGFYETVLGDPARVFGRLDEYRRVTAADIRRAAKRYLETEHRTRIMVQPKRARKRARRARA